MTIQYTKVEFTDKQRKELIRLMLGLTFVETKTKFSMKWWASRQPENNGHNMENQKEPSEVINECGTCACAMGHAPLFCKESPKAYEDWDDYRNRLFGSSNSRNNKYVTRLFIFSSYWPDCWKQAVTRMYIILTKGCPERKSWKYDYPKYRKPSDLIIENYALEYGITVDEVYDRACALTVE